MSRLIFAVLDQALPDVINSVRQANASASLTALTYRTDLSVSGAGYLHAVGAENATGVNGNGYTMIRWRITIDGGASFIVGTSTQALTGIFGNIDTKHMVLGVRFTTSLVVEVYNADSTPRTVTDAITYSLDG